MLIGATRGSVICKNTVLLQNQGPCGSVRTCNVDPVTGDTSAQVKDVTCRNSWRHFRKKKARRGLRDSDPVEGDSIRSINRQTSRCTRQLHRNEIGLSEHCEHGQFKNRNPVAVPALSSMLSSFCVWLFMARLSSVGLIVKDTHTHHFIQSARSHRLR